MAVPDIGYPAGDLHSPLESRGSHALVLLVARADFQMVFVRKADQIAMVDSA
jgi:hypothetical protein